MTMMIDDVVVLGFERGEGEVFSATCNFLDTAFDGLQVPRILTPLTQLVPHKKFARTIRVLA